MPIKAYAGNSIPVGSFPGKPVLVGTNLYVPIGGDNVVSVVDTGMI